MTETAAESAARQATAALVRQYYDAFNAGDHDGMFACLTDDVIHDVNQGERRIGLDKFKAFSARMAHNYAEKLEGIAVMVSRDGVRAAAEFNVVGKYLNSEAGLPEAKGQTYRLPAGTFFEIRDGKIARVTTYYNLTDWIAQVAG
ncbi:MAG: ketosteroid isomerase-related protein [Hyphomicrobiaceae bacterium]|nr:ketosteroid isomerase-related protein [Hyphomicrobiaceae bacterium]